MIEKDLNLFSVPVRKGHVVPTAQQYAETYEYLHSLFVQCTPGKWALETGKSTAELPGGDALFQDPLFDWLTLPLLSDVKDYWVNVLHYRKDYHMYIDSMWANLHGEGDSTGLHAHVNGRGKSHVSLVYYFTKDINSSGLQFANPLEQILRMCPLDASYDDWSRSSGYSYDYYTANTLKTDYLIFPSWLQHRTLPNNNSERIAISINFSGFPIDPTGGEFNEVL
ncbi:putative 2OG-Fe(II) oxygenase [Synechococcus phage S-SZBM1]|uniref:2OG-Fe(II) oxygenase n=1 Tax=Synechococcus phage S-SZBM1 TaxID=2926475 RepID=A0AC61TTM1_9CAUD|nr:2OG-Fe(II) oxygenase [Synechococcus phage S-SZBM1]UNH61160.1 putative 2OG-Fe(II) oxygenase [Synechococcus phage S-SZBM1]